LSARLSAPEFGHPSSCWGRAGYYASGRSIAPGRPTTGGLTVTRPNRSLSHWGWFVKGDKLWPPKWVFPISPKLPRCAVISLKGNPGHPLLCTMDYKRMDEATITAGDPTLISYSKFQALPRFTCRPNSPHGAPPEYSRLPTVYHKGGCLSRVATNYIRVNQGNKTEPPTTTYLPPITGRPPHP
jgi:hypothetical protein